MKHHRLTFWLLIALSVLGTSVLAQGSLSIATGGTGGVYFPVGGAYAELINRYIDGFTAVAEVTGASVENVGLVSRGDSDMALVLADTLQQAFEGTGRFGPDGDLPQLANLRGIAVAYSNTVHIVTLADSGITSLQDLRGRRVSVGAPGSGTEVSAQTILNANGITYDDISEQFLNFNETADALRDGQIDAGFWSVGAPTSSILSLAETRTIRIIPFTEEEIENSIAADPTFAAVNLPGGSYTGQAEDVPTIGTPNVIIVAAEMDDDFVYDFLTVLFDNIDEVIAVHPSANETTIELSLSASPVPLHPAAVRFYQDRGFDVPDNLIGQ